MTLRSLSTRGPESMVTQSEKAIPDLMDVLNMRVHMLLGGSAQSVLRSWPRSPTPRRTGHPRQLQVMPHHVRSASRRPMLPGSVRHIGRIFREHLYFCTNSTSVCSPQRHRSVPERSRVLLPGGGEAVTPPITLPSPCSLCAPEQQRLLQGTSRS